MNPPPSPRADVASPLPLNLERLRRVAVFGAVGVANTLVDFAAFWLLTRLAGWPPLAANVVSFSLGSVNSYVLNGMVTFGHASAPIRSLAQMARFAVVSVASLGVSSAALWAALHVVPTIEAKLASIVATFAFGYVLSSRWVFRGGLRTGTEPPR